MRLRYTCRVHPDGEQRAALARLFGCVRVVRNDALERQNPVKASNKLLGSPKARIAEGPCQRVPKNAEWSGALITEAKKTPQRQWLSKVSPVPLQQALRDLDKAWTAHEDSKTAQRKGTKLGRSSRRTPPRTSSATPTSAGSSPAGTPRRTSPP